MYGIQIGPDSELSQYQQLYLKLRERIHNGSVPPGKRLASTRELSKSLGISRSIVLEVFDQLKVEGYISTVKGSGTYVKHSLVIREEPPEVSSSVGKSAEAAENRISFIAGMPDLAMFPKRDWNRCYKHFVEYAGEEELGYPPYAGAKALREAVSGYLYRMKGISAGPDEIMITSGASQALAIIAVMKKSARILLEDPLAGFVHEIFKACGCRIGYLPVDNEGIVTDSIPSGAADFIYVSPSHQFPLGGTLSAGRRIGLLRTAEKKDAYIIEDDYDGEYRYGSRPIAPICAISRKRVLYIGTFSKILSPALRIGYLVIPPSLADDCRRVKKLWSYLSEGISQNVMAEFIRRGYLDRHVRKSVKHYHDKNKRLLKLIDGILEDGWRVLGATTGLHLVLQRDGAVFDRQYVSRLKKRGIEAETADMYCIRSTEHHDKLILGYGNRRIGELEYALRVIKEVSDNT